MTIFPRTPRSDFHYLIKTTVQGSGRSLSRYSCLMLRSLFFTNDNNNSEYSRNVILACRNTAHFFSLVEDSKQYIVTGVNCQLDGSLPANPVNDRRLANAVTVKSTFCLP